jgi:hypothetical protein
MSNTTNITIVSSYEVYEYEQKFVVDKAMCLS